MYGCVDELYFEISEQVEIGLQKMFCRGYRLDLLRSYHQQVHSPNTGMLRHEIDYFLPEVEHCITFTFYISEKR